MDINLKAQSWCFKNNIKIYIVPLKNTRECYIEISTKKSLIRSDVVYRSQKIASEKIWELYLYFYKNQKKL